MSSTETAYIPGVCNINKTEIAKRRMLGHIGLVVFVILLIIFLSSDISRWYRIILFFPSILAASGYLQAKNHFCTGYAMAGKQNAIDGSTVASDINDEAAKTRDRKTARLINQQAVLIALIVTVVTIFL